MFMVGVGFSGKDKRQRYKTKQLGIITMWVPLFLFITIFIISRLLLAYFLACLVPEGHSRK